MPSYDEIFECFLENSKININNIPATDEGKYSMIKNAVRHYNSKMNTQIECDDITETISDSLNDAQMLILAYCMKYIYHSNALSEFVDIFSVFTKELGINNYNSQLKGKQDIINQTEHKIDELITNTEDASIM